MPDPVPTGAAPDPLPRPELRHVLPFAAWLGIMTLFQHVDIAEWAYLVRTVVCVGLLIWARPWRYYAAPTRRGMFWGVWAGLAVLVVWVAGETEWVGTRFPDLAEWYGKWLVQPLGRVPRRISAADSIYSPENCGWFFTGVRLVGSAFVIAVIEEFFFRGFLYRWLIDRRFLRIDLGEVEWQAFWVTIALFALEHNRFAAGAITGILWGALVLCTRDIWGAILAHVIANFGLSLYVLHTQDYTFW